MQARIENPALSVPGALEALQESTCRMARNLGAFRREPADKDLRMREPDRAGWERLSRSHPDKLKPADGPVRLG